MTATTSCPVYPIAGPRGMTRIPGRDYLFLLFSTLAEGPTIGLLTHQHALQTPILHRVDFRSGFKTVRSLSDLSRIFRSPWSAHTTSNHPYIRVDEPRITVFIPLDHPGFTLTIPIL